MKRPKLYTPPPPPTPPTQGFHFSFFIFKSVAILVTWNCLCKPTRVHACKGTSISTNVRSMRFRYGSGLDLYTSRREDMANHQIFIWQMVVVGGWVGGSRRRRIGRLPVGQGGGGGKLGVIPPPPPPPRRIATLSILVILVEAGCWIPSRFHTEVLLSDM